MSKRPSSKSACAPIRWSRRCWNDFRGPRLSACGAVRMRFRSRLLSQNRRFHCLTTLALATTGSATNEHDPEKWEPVFGYDHAQKENLMADFLGMMKQAAQLQTKMQELQAELDRIEVEGAAGGGMGTVKLSAKGEMRGVKLDPSLMKPEEKEILEDLLVAAHADAR